MAKSETTGILQMTGSNHYGTISKNFYLKDKINGAHSIKIYAKIINYKVTTFGLF